MPTNKLSIAVFKRDDMVIVECDSIQISAYGEDMEAAFEQFCELFEGQRTGLGEWPDDKLSPAAVRVKDTIKQAGF